MRGELEPEDAKSALVKALDRERAVLTKNIAAIQASIDKARLYAAREGGARQAEESVTPTYIRPLPAADDSCETDSLSTVSEDGAFVSTLGGSHYIIDEIDRVDSMLWLETDDVVVCDDGFSVKIIHDGEIAHAHHVR